MISQLKNGDIQGKSGFWDFYMILNKKMSIEPPKFRKALTFVEILVSLLVVLIVVVGVMGYLYAGMANTREAEARMSASRLALLIMESWKANDADITIFNPTQLAGPRIKVDDKNTVVPSGGLSKLLGNPRVTFNGVSYFVKLTYDEEQPQKMEVLVAWDPDNYSQSNNPGLGSRSESVVLLSYAIF